MPFITPEIQIKSGKYAYCPVCAARQRKFKEEFQPLQGSVIWPQPVAWFSNGHVNENGVYICNYHGNTEFNPTHDCETNECD